MDVRKVEPDERDQWNEVLSRTFQSDPTDDWKEVLGKHFEWDRSMGVFVGDEVVGTGGAFTLRFQVPGGEVAAGGLTVITVSPTHRRQGALTDMIRHHFDDVAAHQEPMSALWASESSIYGRFGYGQATRALHLKMDTAKIEFIDPVAPSGQIRHIDLDQARKVLPSLYEQATIRPGMFSRDADFWELEIFRDHEGSRGGWSANRWAVYERDGISQGYLRYRQKPNWTDDGFNDGEAFVGELITLDQDAYRALWNFVLNLDLTVTVSASIRPIDEPLRWMVEDPRRIVTSSSEALWLRLLDVPACLEARRYPQSGRLVLEVTDEFLPQRSGRFELSGGPQEAHCVPTDAEADVTLETNDLASLYLGDAEVAALAFAGRLRGSEESLRLLAAMFRWHEPPWCTSVF
ncbi:MAG: GNAT family N-acetyltransferase [Acidimicrobiia bacterium]|nr:GNAT family N-acetyltransferase [Acidimicrobiia bacterium]MDH3470441.1 GNAT family N-acetyltransferase [Acidimicrobiia bacterium]